MSQSATGMERETMNPEAAGVLAILGSRQALWAMIVVGSALRLLLASGIGPGNDESYHYLFSIHPDWSYFDHPPMVALVESVGLSFVGFHASVLGLRLGSVILFAGSTWLMARLTARYFGGAAGWLAAFALNASAYHGLASATFALPDGPLVFFWLLTLDRLLVALENPDLTSWIAVGLAWGGAMLSKYQAVFLPMSTLAYLMLEPRSRHVLRKPGPYVGFAIGLVAFTPVLYWNASHAWASFAFQGGRAIGHSGFRPDRLVAFVGTQAAYVFPWIWVPVVLVLWSQLRRRWRGEVDAPQCTFLLYQALVPLVAFAAVATLRPILPHWSQVGYLAAFPLLGRAWGARVASTPIRGVRQVVCLVVLWVVLIELVIVHTETGLFQAEGHGLLKLVPAAIDPTLDCYGWDQVTRELQRLNLIGEPGTFLFSDRWYWSSHLAFATDGRIPVACFNRRRGLSFSTWNREIDTVGHDGIYVGIDNCSKSAKNFSRWFERFAPLATFPIIRQGVPVRYVHLFRGIKMNTSFPAGNH
ncbi:glycosyltransferase family 39 protein [Singulisphaera rosea]